MKRTWLWLAALAAGTLTAAEPAGLSDGALLLFGADRDHYDPGFGAAWLQDLTPTLSCFVGVERVSLEDESSYQDAFSSSRTSMEADGYEVQLGYLHHLRRDPDGFSLSLGPAIGLEELEGEQRTTYSGVYGGGTDRTDIDYDLGVSVYLQGLIRYGGFQKVDLFAAVAYGYRSGREARYTTGGGVMPLADASPDAKIGVPYYGDDFRVILGSDTFIRVALGVAIPF